MAYLYNEYDENQVEKTLKKRRHRKVKRKIKILIVLIIACCIIYFLSSDYSRIQTINIEGLNLTSEEDVYNAISVDESSYYFLVNKDDVASEIEALPAVKSATVSIGLLGGMKIEVVEATAIAYAKIGDQYYEINDAGKIVEIDSDYVQQLKLLPYVQSFTDTELLSEFAEQFKDVPSLMQNEISDIILSPQTADETRLKCITKEGRYIYVRIEDMATRLDDSQFNYELYKTHYSDKCVFSIEGNHVYMSEDCE